MNRQQIEWLIEQMDDDQRQRFFDNLRAMIALVPKMCAAVERYEQAGITAAEDYANGGLA